MLEWKNKKKYRASKKNEFLTSTLDFYRRPRTQRRRGRTQRSLFFRKLRENCRRGGENKQVEEKNNRERVIMARDVITCKFERLNKSILGWTSRESGGESAGQFVPLTSFFPLSYIFVCFFFSVQLAFALLQRREFAYGRWNVSCGDTRWLGRRDRTSRGELNLILRKWRLHCATATRRWILLPPPRTIQPKRSAKGGGGRERATKGGQSFV